jgi:4-hydroxybenzoate polyprenyltransferase
MPLPHALADAGHFDGVAFVAGLTGFSLVASATYAFNDCLDAERDRRHPLKRDRVVAAGRVTPRAAALFGVLLLVVGLGLCWASARPLAVVIALTYVAINLVYSVWGRAVPLIDVFLLATGFVLRVLLGCALVTAVASLWLLLCSSTLALFMAFAKRRDDLVNGVDAGHRGSLDGYDVAFLEQAMSMMATLALIAYSIFCMESPVLVEGRQFASLPFVVFGVLEYLRLVRRPIGGGSPVDLLFASRALQVCGVGWVVATLWSLGWI